MKYPVRVITKAEHTLRAGSIVQDENLDAMSDDELTDEHDYEWRIIESEADAIEYCDRVMNGTGQFNAYRFRMVKGIAEYLGILDKLTSHNAV